MTANSTEKNILKQMSVAIDFDGVLSNTIKRWIEIFNTHYAKKYQGLQLSYNKITEWDFYRSYNITRDDSSEIFARCWNQWDLLEPTEFMLSQKTKVLHKLHKNLDIVTAIPPIHEESVREFLKKYKIKHDRIIFAESKEELHHDIFIDDSPANAAKIFGAGKSVFLYDQPWNVDVESQQTENAQLTRVHSLDHTLHILQKTRN